ncbi:DNA-binding transcriptional regulator Fis [Halomonas cibimaris]|uniref:Putative Fis-like DNA-binding protein n=1 Tax=Halomonas cibimaris TaxID=657012 RepID=A0ABP7LX38_9GAMM
MNDRDPIPCQSRPDATVAHDATPQQSAPPPLRDAVEASMRRYFEHLDGGETSDLYAMVIAEVEMPLLAAVLEYTQDNQTRAAKVLGLNRGTLRKKLKHYGLIDHDSA